MNPVHALILHRGLRWRVAPDDTLSFGRDVDRTIRLGHDPDDDFVSRRAGTLTTLPGGVLVQNESATQPFYLQALPGAELVVTPGMAVSTSPHLLSRIVVPGRHGAQYVLTIDTHELGAAGAGTGPSGWPSPPPRGRSTRAGTDKLTPRERRMLAALCEPLLILAGGGAAPATYKQVAARVGTTPQTARNCLDLLRARLSERDGIPRLRADAHEDVRDGAGYLRALAHWAIWAEVITPADLCLLGRPFPG